MITTTFRDKQINIKEKLTLVEAIGFVNSTINNIVDVNDGTYSPEFEEVSFISNFLSTYTDIETIDIEEIYLNQSEYEQLIDTVLRSLEFNADQYYKLKGSIYDKIEFSKQQIIHNQKSSMDEMFDQLTILLSTLNDKAKEIDVKKLEKVIKKLNPEAVLKAYQKSGVGESARDKAIQEQALEIKNLKNQISARNVMA